jgi:hypothetical protein
MNLAYTNLDVWIEQSPGASSYRARVTHDEQGTDASVTFEKPISDEDLKELVAGMPGGVRDIRLRPPDSSRDLSIQMGRRLYDAVFSREVLRVMAVAVASARGSEEMGLRIRLRLEGDVATWPWELLHDGKDFLALSVKTPIVRCPKDSESLRALKVTLPLRVLVVTSSPPECEKLAIEREWQNIEHALTGIERVEIERLDDPTFAILGARLRKGHFHVLHFIGHGKFNHQGKKGQILLIDERGGTDPVDGTALGGLLRDRGIRLVVLNACEGAGVAQRLIELGVPAVIAMQHVVADRSAVIFAQHLYESLAEGDPVDGAMSEARHGINVANQNQGVDWATPVLFLRSPEGHLFDVAPDRPGIPRKASVAALVILGALALTGLLWRSRELWLKPLSSGATQASILMPPPIQCLAPQALPDMRLILVRGDTFLMGSSAGEEDEEPEHRVKISKDFCLGAYEVTQKQWTEIMGPNSVRSDSLGNDLPVTKVSYEEVQEFLRRLNEKEGPEIFRLPWEAEWELASQSPGGGWNCDGGAGSDHFDGLAPVGSLEPNRQGFYDMFGNAWEWVGDWYGPYDEGTFIDPQGPRSGEVRVRKGGAFDSAPKHCRPARRETLKPGSRFQNTGFRILRELHK